MNVMTELIELIIIQILVVTFWSCVLNAPILQYRARKLTNWYIDYKDAALVSVKAGIAGVIIGFITMFIIALVDNTNIKLLKSLGMLFGIAAWWFILSNGLLNLTDPARTLSLKEARAISSSVLRFYIIFALIVALIVILLGVLIKWGR